MTDPCRIGNRSDLALTSIELGCCKDFLVICSTLLVWIGQEPVRGPYIIIGPRSFKVRQQLGSCPPCLWASAGSFVHVVSLLYLLNHRQQTDVAITGFRNQSARITVKYPPMFSLLETLANKCCFQSPSEHKNQNERKEKDGVLRGGDWGAEPLSTP